MSPVQVHYRFFQDDTPIPPTHPPVAIPDDVASGDLLTLDADIVCPDVPGRYTIEIDLARAFVDRFATEVGTPLGQGTISVAPPTAAPSSPTLDPAIPNG